MSILVENCLSTLLDVSAKSVFLAIVALTILYGSRTRNSSLHHGVWLAVLVAMLALPVLGWLSPATAIPLPEISTWSTKYATESQPNNQVRLEQAPDSSTEQNAIEKTRELASNPLSAPRNEPLANSSPSPTAKEPAMQLPSWPLVVAAVYFLGLILFLSRFLVGIRGVLRLAQRAKVIHLPGQWATTILESDEVRVPMTVGSLRPSILLPRDWNSWPPEMLQSVLYHEQVHVGRRDYLVGCLAELNRAFYWFHPLAWLLRERLATLAEQTCDDLVVAKLGNPQAYASHLLQVATNLSTDGQRIIALGVPMIRSSHLEARIGTILDATRPLARRLKRRETLLLVAVALSIACLTAGLRAADKATSTSQANKNGANATTIAAADKTEQPAFELSKTVRVVNSDGDPIVGATVTPWAMRAGRGHGPWTPKGFGASEPPILTTDENGVVVIPFPRYANKAEKTEPNELTCRVEHPDYANTEYNNVPVNQEQLDDIFTIKLLPGAQIVVTARAGGTLLPAASLHAQWGGFSLGEQPKIGDSGRLILPRLSAGPRLLRVVALPENEEPLFSEVRRLELNEGEQLELELELELKPGVIVQGQLDAMAKRPIKNGRVIAKVIEFNPDGSFNSLQWQVWAPIEEDGTFTLPAMPRGQLQVIALCDGFLAESGTPPGFAAEHEKNSAGMRPRPQVFDLAVDEAEITLKMTPTAACGFLVLGPDKQPLEHAICYSWPNIAWWRGGSQLYGRPLLNSAEVLKDPNLLQTYLLNKRGDNPYSAKTDSSGKAIVRGLPAGTNYFGVKHDDYEMPIGEWNRRGGKAEFQSGELTSVTVTLQPKGTEFVGEQVEQKPAQINMTQQNVTRIPKPPLPKSFETQVDETELAGVVIDEAGKPLSGVTVDAWTWHSGNEMVTDDQGRFRLTGFDREEQVEILFTKDEFSPSLFVAKQAGSDDWTIVLTQGTWLEGTVLSPEGDPVPYAEVKAARGPFRNPQVSITEVTTQTQADDEGNYRLHLEPGKYDVQTRIIGAGTARFPEIELADKEKKQLDIQLDSGVTFQAMVRDSISGEPVEGFVLWNWRQPDVESVSEEDGLLEIEGMMPGEFEFNVTSIYEDRRRSSVAGNYARWWSEQATKPHEREETHEDSKFQRNFDSLSFDLQGEVYRVDVFVEPLVTIHGQVLDPDGNPVEGATVAPAKTGSGNSITGDTRYSYETDADGRYTVKLPASKNAKYNLVAHDGKYKEWRNWANGVSEPFQTKPGQVIEDFELRLTRPATVRGKITNALGTPRAHVKVRAAAVDLRDNRYYHPETETDADGNYELRFIRPGKHHIQTEPFWLPTTAAPSQTSQIVDLEPDETELDVNFKKD